MKHQTKSYHTNVSVFPKVAVVERVIRTIKNWFFKYLTHYRTLRWINLIKIIQDKYNETPHSSLFYFTPLQAHHDSHINSYINKKTMLKYKKRQIKSQSIFHNLPSHQRHQINNKVLLRLKRSKFSKEHSFKNQVWSQQIFTIKNIDKSQYPYLYSLNNKPNQKFYGFELQSANFDNIQNIENTINNDNDNKKPIKSDLIVKNFRFENNSRLRSGKIKPNSGILQYYVIQNNKNSEQTNGEWLSPESLKFRLRAFGRNHISYDPSVFNTAENQKLMIY
jgi:hypothetical protein